MSVQPRSDQHSRLSIEQSSLEFGTDAGGRGETQVATRDDGFSAAKPFQLLGLPLFGTSIDCFGGQQCPQLCFASRHDLLVFRVVDQIICLFWIVLKVEELWPILDVVDVLVMPVADGKRSGG